VRCPYCGGTETGVIDKRDSADGSVIKRRRRCEACQRRFTTYERIEVDRLYVVKKDGRRQEFDRAKLRHSIQLACTKRPIPAETIDRVVEEIEATLRLKDRPEVPSSVIGDLVMEHLKRLDKVAYIRFASVYRNFADISSFEEALSQLAAIRSGSGAE
jgi:transcriptional repressor NrdR